MRKRCLGLVGLLLVAAPTTAAAQQESATEEARSLFEAGRTAYDAGRFQSALEYFERAYELSHRPALLFNMGSASERLRRDEDAVRHYEQYLRELPEADNREFVQSRIEFLQSTERQAQTHPSGSTRVDSQPSGGDILGEWWFWTIIALVVVGAGVSIGVGVAMSDPGTEAPISGNFGSTGLAMALVSF